MLICIMVFLFGFGMGGLFTIVVLHRDIFKFNRMNKIESDMLRNLIVTDGEGNQDRELAEKLIRYFGKDLRDLGGD